MVIVDVDDDHGVIRHGQERIRIVLVRDQRLYPRALGVGEDGVADLVAGQQRDDSRTCSGVASSATCSTGGWSGSWTQHWTWIVTTAH